MIKPFSVRLTAAQRTAVERLADARNVSASDVIRTLVDAGLTIDQVDRELLGEKFQDAIGRTVGELVTQSFCETIEAEVARAIRSTVAAELGPLLQQYATSHEDLRTRVEKVERTSDSEMQSVKEELAEVRKLATQKRGGFFG